MHITKMTCNRSHGADDAIKTVGSAHIAKCKSCFENARIALENDLDAIVNDDNGTLHIVGVCYDE